MQVVRRTLAVALALFLVAPQVNAQAVSKPQPAPQTLIDQALAQRAADAAAERQLIRRVLDRDEVRTVAAQMGVDITRVQSSVGLLDSDQLTQVADQARQVDRNLAGGATTVTITATTIIIALLIIIIIVLIAD